MEATGKWQQTFQQNTSGKAKFLINCQKETNNCLEQTVKLFPFNFMYLTSRNHNKKLLDNTKVNQIHSY